MQETVMKEYIEREAARDLLEAAWVDDWCLSYSNDRLDEIPAADVVEVRHGRWIDDKVSFYLGCSECGCFLEYAVDTFLDNGDHYNYCPNCGALMDKEEAETT